MRPLVCETKAGISGYYTFHKKLPSGELVPLLDGAKSKNLIVDQWLNAFKTYINSPVTPNNSATSTSSASYQIVRQIAVGTGSTPPTVANTGLVSQLAAKTDNNDSIVNNTYSYNEASDHFIFNHSKTLFFPLGGVVGNISEVGVFSTTTSNATINAMVSRALITDGLGNPTTITLTAEDQLAVTYTMVLVVPRTISFNFNYLDVDYNLEGKLSTTNPTSATGFSRLLASNFSTSFYSRSTDVNYPNPTASGIDSSGWTVLNSAATVIQVPPLNPASVRKARHRFPLGSSNFAGGIKCFSPQLGSGWMFKFTPAFPKTANEILEVEFSTDFVRL